VPRENVKKIDFLKKEKKKEKGLYTGLIMRLPVLLEVSIIKLCLPLEPFNFYVEQKRKSLNVFLTEGLDIVLLNQNVL
jgi:hypothetical protein